MRVDKFTEFPKFTELSKPVHKSPCQGGCLKGRGFSLLPTPFVPLTVPSPLTGGFQNNSSIPSFCSLLSALCSFIIHFCATCRYRICASQVRGNVISSSQFNSETMQELRKSRGSSSSQTIMVLFLTFFSTTYSAGPPPTQMPFLCQIVY